jgi:hypothetical protein
VTGSPAEPGKPSSAEDRRRRIEIALGAAVALSALAVAGLVHGWRGRDGSFSILAGLAFGAVLQRSRFCFASAFRDVFLLRERRAALGVLSALAVGTAGYLVVFGAQMPDPSGEFVPPTAHIGRAGWHLLLGGITFGAGMAVAGGCISGSLFRVGEGNLASLLALSGVVAGFVLGFRSWNWLWVTTVAAAPTVWLPHSTGYAISALIQFAFLAALAVLLVWRLPGPRPVIEPSPLRAVFVRAWPAWIGGAAVGLVATAAYFRTQPLGVTAEFGRLARLTGLAPDRLEGLDQIAGCRVPSGGPISLDGLFVLALVAGSFAAALGAGEFRLRLPRLRPALLAVAGGLLMGFGAMISAGCTVGTFLSGTMALSLHGWLFGAALLAGASIGGLALRRIESKREIDVRGEVCPVPAIRVQQFIRGNPHEPSFIVRGDHLPAMESMEAIAARHRFTCAFERAPDGDWIATFSKPS